MSSSSDEDIPETPEAIQFRAEAKISHPKPRDFVVEDSPSLISESVVEDSELDDSAPAPHIARKNLRGSYLGSKAGDKWSDSEDNLSVRDAPFDCVINSTMNNNSSKRFQKDGNMSGISEDGSFRIFKKVVTNQGTQLDYSAEEASESRPNGSKATGRQRFLDDSTENSRAKPRQRFLDESSKPEKPKSRYFSDSLDDDRPVKVDKPKARLDESADYSYDDSPPVRKPAKMTAAIISDDSEDEFETPETSISKESKKRIGSRRTILSDSEEEEVDEKGDDSEIVISDDYDSSPLVKSKKPTKQKNRIFDYSIQEVESSPDVRSKGSSVRPKDRQVTTETQVTMAESDEDEIDDESGDESSVGDESVDDESGGDESGDDESDDDYSASEEEPSPIAAKPKVPIAKTPRAKLRPESDEDEDEVQILPTPKTKKKSTPVHTSFERNNSYDASHFEPGRKFTPKEIRDLHAQLASIKKEIENKEVLLHRSPNLQDNGQKLRQFIGKLKDKESELVAKIYHARDNIESESPAIDQLNKSATIEDLTAELTQLQVQERCLRQGFAATRIEQLPDKGMSMQNQLRDLRQKIATIETKIRISKPSPGQKHALLLNEAPGAQSWSANLNFGNTNLKDARLYADAPAANQLYGGRMNQARRIEIGTVTQDAIKSLHDCLKEMPTEKDEESDPKSLKKSVQLFPHQRQALAWMLWRETKKPPGGILADDMGLGKTLTLISLIVKHREIMEDRKEADEEEEKENEWLGKMSKNLIRSKATLVICPASLIGHWEKEAKDRLREGTLRTLVYHGTNRGQSAKSLSRYDLIVTTYGTVMSEMKSVLAKSKETKLDEMTGTVEDGGAEAKNIQLLSIVWDRIILDEAHQIRNPRSQTALAVCKLRGARRWAVTGTPIQNKELDMYSLVRFLRLSPFDEYRAWKVWVDNKTSMGQQRMNTLVRSMMLRRTKEQKNATTGKEIVSLPPKSIEEHKITLTEVERKVYDEVFSFSQQAMINYMQKQQDKDEDKQLINHVSTYGKSQGFEFKDGSNSAAVAHVMPKSLGDNKDVKAHHLLVLLLRLRQICCHPGLIKSMLDSESKANGGLEDEDGEDLDLLSQLADMSIRSDASEKPIDENILDRSNPVFDEKKESSKISTVINELIRLKKKSQETGEMEKAVIVSQWTSMLEIMSTHVKRIGLKCCAINGSIPVKSRGEIVNDFNRTNFGPQVMLLSLAAGGVGLNLVGANHLFLLDMHWNPQLEQQACDRIYRVGQKREVTIHKFLCEDTVESRILQLQAKKLELANGVLTGAQSRGVGKLTFDDLKTLFNLDVQDKGLKASNSKSNLKAPVSNHVLPKI